MRAVDGGHVGAALVVVLGDVHFVLGQRLHDVAHAQQRVRRVARIRKAHGQLAKGLKRLFGRFLVALGQVLAGVAAKNAQVFIEIGRALEVQRIVQRGAGGVQAHKAVNRGHGLDGLAGLDVRIGFVHLRLLGQGRASGAGFELFQQGNGLFPLAGVHFVFGIGIELRGRHARGLVQGRRGAADHQRRRQWKDERVNDR